MLCVLEILAVRQEFSIHLELYRLNVLPFSRFWKLISGFPGSPQLESNVIDSKFPEKLTR